MSYYHSENVPSINPHLTLYVADLPKSTSYMDLHEVFEKKVAPCDIIIKR